MYAVSELCVCQDADTPNLWGEHPQLGVALAPSLFTSSHFFAQLCCTNIIIFCVCHVTKSTDLISGLLLIVHLKYTNLTTNIFRKQLLEITYMKAVNEEKNFCCRVTF